ncbi:hypothetical protein LPB19_15750 [Marinobacter salinisoli]|uniref:Uncharacterized protein n=1 Tax=Marinobacter salinisoli TaxID=2769486 RepID=A0ABX7MT73_9GAMM|nr:hypothetical protein [Marinobacter salinisoli]QSP94604.1 hypothetical protein LPB19_15750 [Marinobacter salinisoli]
MIAFLTRNVGAGLSARLKTLTLIGLLPLAGCSMEPIYKTTGVVMSGYSWTEATPYVMQMSDPTMACALGEGVDPLLYSFSEVVDAPDDSGSLLMALAANCVEYRAWEAELDYLRADYAGDVVAAKNAREMAKRLNAESAVRRHRSFERAMAAYDFDPAAEPLVCPDFDDEQDELTFLLGLLNGMQAIVNDSNSGARAGIPRNIAPQAERAATCVNNDKWAGLPSAVRALVWLLLPDTQPDSATDPWKVLDKSSDMSIRAGMRASMAIEVVAAETFGRPDILEQTIAEFASADGRMKVWEDYRLVDVVAGTIVQFASDKHWAANYGHRTPQGAFGKLSPENPMSDMETMDLDGLL